MTPQGPDGESSNSRRKSLVGLYLAVRMDPPVQNVPAIHPVIRHARVAAARARTATCDRAVVLSGASAAVPPTNIAIDAKCAKPQSA
jgi:hypothetical protein